MKWARETEQTQRAMNKRRKREWMSEWVSEKGEDKMSVFGQNIFQNICVKWSEQALGINFWPMYAFPSGAMRFCHYLPAPLFVSTTFYIVTSLWQPTSYSRLLAIRQICCCWHFSFSSLSFTCTFVLVLYLYRHPPTMKSLALPPFSLAQHTHTHIVWYINV